MGGLAILTPPPFLLAERLGESCWKDVRAHTAGTSRRRGFGCPAGARAHSRRYLAPGSLPNTAEWRKNLPTRSAAPPSAPPSLPPSLLPRPPARAPCAQPRCRPSRRQRHSGPPARSRRPPSAPLSASCAATLDCLAQQASPGAGCRQCRTHALGHDSMLGHRIDA